MPAALYFFFPTEPPWPLVLVPVKTLVLILSLASLIGKVDALLGDKDGLLEGGRGDRGGVASAAFSALLLLKEAAHDMPGFKIQSTTNGETVVPQSPEPLVREVS